MKKYFLAIMALLLLNACSSEQEKKMATSFCIKDVDNIKMSLLEAQKIGKKSGCVKEGRFKETHLCNSLTGTWSIDLDVKKQGCAPACVVDIATKKAEVNYRCIGLNP